jgi:hypothetical protein
MIEMKIQRPFAIILFCFSILLQPQCKQPDKDNAFWSFTAGNSPVYHVKTLQHQPGKRAVVAAGMDGTTSCFSPEGILIWKSAPTGGFPFDLATGDIDHDGLDEVLVAAGNGSLYAYDQDGRMLWVFERRPPLYQVCIARNAEGKATIFTGGIEQVLYALAPDGRVRNSMPTEHVIRHLRAGNALGDGRDYLAMATASSGLTPVLKLFLLNPDDLSTLWQRDDISVPRMNPGRRFFSMLFTDLDKDGKQELVMGGGWRENGMIYAFNDKGETIFSGSDRVIPSIPYRMSLLRRIETREDDFILGHFGNVLILYETDGSLREVFSGPYAFAGSDYDPELQTFFMGSEVSGGTEIYAYRMDNPGWKEAFIHQKASGRLKEIEDNIATLNNQIQAFTAPEYQPAPKKTLAITQIGDVSPFSKVEFARNITLSQKIDNPDELWCRERDNRNGYKHTAGELVDIIKEKEAAGENVLVWAGHGNAVFFPLSTFEQMMLAAPKHLKGFVFAEMEGTGENTQEVVEQLLLPLAELCLKHGKIIFFRNKNVFWSGTCYLPFWSKVLLNDKYKDVFIPGLEETNSRTQELSLAGRIGLWQTNCFTHWACRTVTDNANFDRMFEWGAQQIITHHFRNLVSTASMGADMFFSDIHGGEQTAGMFAQLVPFYEMLEKGIIQIPTQEQLLSCSDFALVMKSPPSPQYLRSGMNGHRYDFPNATDQEMVFNQLDTYWGGSTLPDYDFSAYAMNVKQRTCNFLPELPYGIVPIIPAMESGSNRFKNTITTDGEFFFDEAGNTIPASQLKSKVEEALKSAAERLPVIVAGEAHWSAVKLDEKHIRLTLMDPGYLDPASRKTEIIFQHVKPKKCTDILSSERLKISGNKVQLTIPAGIFRIIDVELK